MPNLFFATLLLAGLAPTPLPTSLPDLDVTSPAGSGHVVSATAPDAPDAADARVQDLLRRLDRLSTEEQLRLYFGSAPKSAGESVYSLRRFASDPALHRTFEAIDSAWLAGAPLPAAAPSLDASLRRLVETKVMVARNLYLRSEAPTRHAAEAEVERLRTTRDRYEHLPLFAGRTVVYAASDDRLRDGRAQFGRLPERVVLEREASRFHFFRGDDHPLEDLAELIRREPELTFVFEGHGRDKALKLGGKLTARRLARFLADRPAHYPPAVVIVDACRSHDFARNLYRELTDLDANERAPLPIVVVPDEYGQSILKDVFQAGFLRGDLMGRDGSEASLGSALQASNLRLSVYVPGRGGRPMQIG